MNLLLDTHVWIWSQEDPVRIGKQARAGLAAAQRLFVATISSLEIARLIHVGSIELEGDLGGWIKDSLDALQGDEIAMSREVAMGAYQLEAPFHKDPADRILVATALMHNLTLVTADERILAYTPLPTLDARR